jgi:hypothetical protein
MTRPTYLALQFFWSSGTAFTNYSFILFAGTVVPLQGKNTLYDTYDCPVHHSHLVCLNNTCAMHFRSLELLQLRPHETAQACQGAVIKSHIKHWRISKKAKWRIYRTSDEIHHSWHCRNYLCAPSNLRIIAR